MASTQPSTPPEGQKDGSTASHADLERQLLVEELRLRREQVTLERERFQASQQKPPSWTASFRAGLVAAVPVLVALAGPAAGLVQYGWSQVDAARIQARTAFVNKKVALYEKAIAASGQLATTQVGTPAFAKALARFEQLYWAELPLVESKAVEQEMINLRSAAFAQDAAEIRDSVYRLAEAIRQDLRDAYGDPPARSLSRSTAPNGRGTPHRPVTSSFFASRYY